MRQVNEYLSPSISLRGAHIFDVTACVTAVTELDANKVVIRKHFGRTQASSVYKFKDGHGLNFLLSSGKFRGIAYYRKRRREAC